MNITNFKDGMIDDATSSYQRYDKATNQQITEIITSISEDN